MITIYTRAQCHYCFAAKRLLALRGLEYSEVNIDAECGAADLMLLLTGGRSVPQVVINEEAIGGARPGATSP